MFSSILKIIPKLDESTLRKMEKNLQSRFTKVAKGFGRGLQAAVKLGGIASIGLALIDRILNPLKEIQEAIDRTLKSSDDVVTNAKQFNTTAGKLSKLIALGESTGLDQDSLFMLINKFQTAVAEAGADPKAPSSVRAFVGREDSAAAFFEFIQSLQKMGKNEQLLVQQNVFGEKQILKMADFLQTNFVEQFKKIRINKFNTAQLTRDQEYLGGLSDRSDELAATRKLGDIGAKARAINDSMITARNRSEQLALDKENKRIQSYNDLAKLSDTAEKIMGLVDSAVAMLGKAVGFITDKLKPFIENLEKLLQSPFFKGIFKGGGR